MRKTLSIILLLVGTLFACILGLVYSARPPKDAILVERFHAHRSAFEKLREMLRQDSNIRTVRSFGITTTNAHSFDSAPEQIGFPRERYEEYLATLKMAGATIAGHDESEFYFRVARWGMAGSGWEIQVVSEDSVPTNQVPNLDDYWRASVPKEDVYRHIEDNWYLWMHWHK